MEEWQWGGGSEQSGHGTRRVPAAVPSQLVGPPGGARSAALFLALAADVPAAWRLPLPRRRAATPSGSAPCRTGVPVSPDGNRIYVTDAMDGRVTVITRQ